ncbi:hypothetical protein SBE55_27995 [Mycolicibacterium sp. 141076]|uniref:hypothetical protein n=1 Tax=Mycobacteriaceae TaxID=1762 RepID=UPI00299D7EEE|nr:hypothetical protein [Mycolicibacterium sp. 141076]MDX1881645.1 hypothetical protein [Mycolicibacterium sp. 141076]
MSTDVSAQPEVLPDNCEVACAVTCDPPRSQDEGGLLDYDEPQPVFGNRGALVLVVAAALLAPADPRDGLAPVEE